MQSRLMGGRNGRRDRSPLRTLSAVRQHCTQPAPFVWITSSKPQAGDLHQRVNLGPSFRTRASPRQERQVHSVSVIFPHEVQQ